MSKYSWLFLFALLLTGISLFKCENVHAQDPKPEWVRIETEDGNIFTGKLISENSEKVVVLSGSAGEISIRKNSILRLTRLDREPSDNGDYRHENPQSTRYLFAPNAIGLKKGSGYYQNTWILFNNVNAGITNNFSIGIGTVPLFLFGASSTPFWITPKISLPFADRNVYISVGGLIGGAIGADNGSGGLFYGSATVGNTDRNLTLGLGYGYASSEVSNTPAVNISGMMRTGKTVYLITENYLFPGTDFNGIASFGVRWAPERFAVDFALLRPLEATGSFIALPWIGVTIPFSI